MNRRRLVALVISAFWATACSRAAQQQPITGAIAAKPGCPLLAGKYAIQGEDGQVHISIEQEGCERATIVRESGYLGTITTEKHVFKLDGTVRDDSSWFGSQDQYKSSGIFKKSALQIEAKTANGTLTMVYSLTPEGDLLEDVFINGQRTGGGPVVAKRQN